MFDSIYKNQIKMMEKFLNQKREYIKLLKESKNILEQKNNILELKNRILKETNEFLEEKNELLKERNNNPYQTVEQMENIIGHWAWDEKYQLYRHLSSISTEYGYANSFEVGRGMLNFREYSIDCYDEMKKINHNGVKTCIFEPNRFYPYEVVKEKNNKKEGVTTQ